MLPTRASLREFEGRPLEETRTHSQLQSSADNKSSELPLTFGVELEVVLATQVEACSRSEFAWLHKCPKASLIRAVGESDDYRSHLMYPQLTKASNILKRCNLDHVVSPDKHTDSQRWGLVPDITVNSSGRDEIMKKLPDRVDKRSRTQWEAHGVELVSRVFPAPNISQAGVLYSDPSFAEINNYLVALYGKSDTPYGIYTNNSCGLHVHVGLDPRKSGNGNLPLDIIQHLSYILVQFETSISALHSRERRAYADTIRGSGSLLGSNLMGLRQARHICDKIPMPLLAKIQDRIFAETMTIEELARLMSETMRGVPMLGHPIASVSRYKFVNFARLVGPPKVNGARTIEFRQHNGSSNIDEIGRWVLFVVRLVRAAERLAARSKPASPDSPSAMSKQRALEIHMLLPFARKQGNKYKLKCQKQSEEYERLFDLMEMPRLDREFWIDRYRRHNPEEVRSGNDRLLSVTEEDCPVCAENSTKISYSPGLERIAEEGLFSDSSDAMEQEMDRIQMLWGIQSDLNNLSNVSGNEREEAHLSYISENDVLDASNELFEPHFRGSVEGENTFDKSGFRASSQKRSREEGDKDSRKKRSP